MSRTKPNKLKGDKKYTDAPRFQVCYGYEDDFKETFSKLTQQLNKSLVTKMNELVTKK